MELGLINPSWDYGYLSAKVTLLTCKMFSKGKLAYLGDNFIWALRMKFDLTNCYFIAPPTQVGLETKHKLTCGKFAHHTGLSITGLQCTAFLVKLESNFFELTVINQNHSNHSIWSITNYADIPKNQLRIELNTLCSWHKAQCKFRKI